MAFNWKQFFAFLGVNGSAAVLNMSARYVIGLFTGYNLSIILAYIIGMTYAFIFNKKYIFTKARQKFSLSVIFFVLVNVEGLLQTLLVSYILLWIFAQTDFTFHPQTAAHFGGVSSTAISGYFGHKIFSFKEYKTNEHIE